MIVQFGLEKTDRVDVLPLAQLEGERDRGIQSASERFKPLRARIEDFTAIRVTYLIA